MHKKINLDKNLRVSGKKLNKSFCMLRLLAGKCTARKDQLDEHSLERAGLYIHATITAKWRSHDVNRFKRLPARLRADYAICRMFREPSRFKCCRYFLRK